VWSAAQVFEWRQVYGDNTMIVWNVLAETITGRTGKQCRDR
jgi:hypothetical protein